MVKTTTKTRRKIPEDIYRSPLRYPGGKQRAIKKIFEMFPDSVREYREPMVGGGSVFFHARNIGFAESYWINDEFSELVSFWQTVQDKELCFRLVCDLEELHREFDSDAKRIKKYFLKARQEVPEDKYRQALLFFFFNRVTFSGTTRAGGFSSQASIDRFTRSSIEKLKALPEALKRTRITRGDFESVIQESAEDVFIFLDPPYVTAKRLYGKDGSLHEFDHERLSKVLRNTNHRFLITYDDCDTIRKFYSWAKITEWNLQYGMNNCNSENTSKRGKELFISNY